MERRYRVEIENYHDRSIEITVLDQLPVPQDELIKVELLKDSTKPTEVDLDGRKGVLSWVRMVEPKDKELILFGYAVTFPVGETVLGF